MGARLRARPSRRASRASSAKRARPSPGSSHQTARMEPTQSRGFKVLTQTTQRPPPWCGQSAERQRSCLAHVGARLLPRGAGASHDAGDRFFFCQKEGLEESLVHRVPTVPHPAVPATLVLQPCGSQGLKVPQSFGDPSQEAKPNTNPSGTDSSVSWRADRINN